MQPGDRVIVDTWLDPAAAERCRYIPGHRTRAILESPEVVEAWHTPCYWVTADPDVRLLAPVTCVIPDTYHAR